MPVKENATFANDKMVKVRACVCVCVFRVARVCVQACIHERDQWPIAEMCMLVVVVCVCVCAVVVSKDKLLNKN